MKHLLGLFFFLSACATAPLTNNQRPSITPDEYAEVIHTGSDRTRQYSGLYNTIDLEATLLKPTIMNSQLLRQADLYQWDEKQFTNEKSRVEARLNKESELFLSFFTPDRKNDDLAKSRSMWKVFLDVEGKRYEGKFKKVKLETAEIQGLYPYHNRFYSAYSVTFPVPMNSIQGKAMQVTLTGPIASGALKF